MVTPTHRQSIVFPLFFTSFREEGLVVPFHFNPDLSFSFISGNLLSSVMEDCSMLSKWSKLFVYFFNCLPSQGCHQCLKYLPRTSTTHRCSCTSFHVLCVSGVFLRLGPMESEKDRITWGFFSLCFCRLDNPSYEVMQLEFEVDNVINLVPTQTLHWNVEYPAGMQTTSRQTEKVSHLYISNADIQGIVPLAEVWDDLMDVHGCTCLWAVSVRMLTSHISTRILYRKRLLFSLS